MEYNLKNENETKDIVKILGPHLRQCEVILFEGDLGAGKTFFIREFLREMSSDKGLVVPSPTYTLVQDYELDDSKFFHFDLYRLEDPDEIFELGWEEALAEGSVLVEWPSRLGPYIPEKYTLVKIEKTGEGARKLTILDKN